MKKSPTDYTSPAHLSVGEIKSTTRDMLSDQRTLLGEIKFLAGIVETHRNLLVQALAETDKNLATIDRTVDRMINGKPVKVKVSVRGIPDNDCYDDYTTQD